MKLQSGYGLKEKIRDGRKLTLRLQWYHLTTTEAKDVIAQIENMCQYIFQEQNMLFLGTINGRKATRSQLQLPWKGKRDFYMHLQGFVRTDESVRAQLKRIREKLDVDTDDIRVPAVVQEQEVARLKEFLSNTDMSYDSEEFPVESLIYFRCKYCDDYTYSVNCSISVSAYAIGYALQELTEFYTENLRSFYQNTGLFAGYIFYELQNQGSHDYYHLPPVKLFERMKEGKFLLGYEWAAYLSGDLVRQLTEEQISVLAQHADIVKEQGGLFYQTRCDIKEYGIAQKRVYYEIFQPILKPGFQYVPISAFYENKSQPADEQVYLLKARKERCSCGAPRYYVGFFYKTKLEETPVYSFFHVVEKIQWKG